MAYAWTLTARGPIQALPFSHGPLLATALISSSTSFLTPTNGLLFFRFLMHVFITAKEKGEGEGKEEEKKGREKRGEKG